RSALVQRSFQVDDVLEFRPFMRQVLQFVSKLREKCDEGELPKTPENEKLFQSIPDLFKWMEELSGKYVLAPSSLYADKFDDYLKGLKAALRSFRLGDVLTLRPEATASVCRAYIEHNMQQLPQPQKLYYIGPMFRRERPQKGRYRQFYQIGAEVLENVKPDPMRDAAKELAKDAITDAELIQMLMTFFDKLKLPGVQLEINSIGHAADNCRRGYVALLKSELEKVKDKLGADSQRRIETNPLRVLDSKLEHEQPIIATLPKIADHLCDDCKTHYAAVKRELELRGVFYKENWRLVRGLDYYMRTTFEITAQGLGSQNAVCGGGRYDGL